MIAEELDVDPASITMVMGHTDETPDGGYSAGFRMGGNNQKKVAAYTRQALVGLASTRLGVPVASLTVTKGVVSGSGKSVSYGDPVKGQQRGRSRQLRRADCRVAAFFDATGVMPRGIPLTRAYVRSLLGALVRFRTRQCHRPLFTEDRTRHPIRKRGIMLASGTVDRIEAGFKGRS